MGPQANLLNDRSLPRWEWLPYAHLDLGSAKGLSFNGMCMRTLIIACVFTVLPALGCGDETNPPVTPEIISAKAVCRDVMGVPKLILVEVHVRDLNGINDLGDPGLIIEANRMSMAREAIFPNGNDRCSAPEDCTGGETCSAGHCLAAGAVAPDLRDISGCQAGGTGCDLRFVWERDGSSEQIYCGVEDSTLQIEFSVMDSAGNTLNGAIVPTSD